MRKVYPNSELFHIFFHRPEGLDEARNSSGNVSWRGNRCYSYSSEIGYCDFNKMVFYFNNGSFSSTTNKHQGRLFSAIPSGYEIICFTEWRDYQPKGYDAPPSLKPWLDRLIIKAKENRDALYSGTKYFGYKNYVDSQIEGVKDTLERVQDLSLFDWFKSEISKYIWTEEECLRWDVKDWAWSNEMLGSYDKKKKHYLDPKLKAEIEAKFQAQISDRAEKAKQRLLLEAQRHQENLNKWLKGEYGIYYLYNVPIHLRLRGDIVETTLGAAVPLHQAKLLFYKFSNCIAENKEWHTNGDKFHVGYYPVTSISKKKSPFLSEPSWCIVAGCHTIYEAEIKKFVVDNHLDW